MFKSKKTQFAIRKFTQGTVAVLLSFGLLGSSLSGIVAATENRGGYSDSVKTGDIKISYIDENGKDISSPPTLTLEENEVKTRQELINYINQNLPSSYEVADKNYGNIQDVHLAYDNQSINIQVEVKKIPVQVEENSDIKISYVDENGYIIASLSEITLKKGETKTRQELVDLIKNNLNQEYELVDPNLSNIQDITSTGNNASIDIKIQVKKINVDYYNDIKISYQTADQKTIKVLDTINLKKGETKSVAELKKLINDQLPNNYKITKIIGLDKDIVAVEGSENISHDITVEIEAATTTITPNDVENPEEEGYIKRITRTINITLPDGEKKQKVQTVTYQRNKVITGDQSSWSHWELSKKSEKSWAKVQIQQFDGYRSVVDNVLSKVIADKEVYCDDQDETVDVGYVSDEKNFKLKIRYVDEDGNTVKNLAGIPLADQETLTPSQLKETIDNNIPDYYEIDEDYEYPAQDITVNGKNPEDIIVKVSRHTVLPEDPDSQGELFKRISRVVHITKPASSGLKDRTETQTITFSRKKVKVNNKTKANDSSQWTYTDWQLHNSESQTGKWDTVEVKHIPGYKAIIHYPKFELFTDEDERHIEDHMVEEREVVLDPQYEDPNDMTRDVFVSYQPLASDNPNNPVEPSDPSEPTTPVDPDNPSTPDQPSTDDSSSSTSPNNPDEIVDSELTSTSNSNSIIPNNSTSYPNKNIATIQPLASEFARAESIPLATNDDSYLPQAGSHTTLKTSTAGLISIAVSTLLGSIGYLISKKKK